MKKVLIAFVAGLTLAFAVLLGVGIYLKSESGKKQTLGVYKSKAQQSEAKIRLIGLYTSMQVFRAENGKFPSVLPQDELSGQNSGSQNIYEIGFLSNITDANRLQLATKYCPDCVVSDSSFKLVAIGNIDEDATMDIWTVDHNKTLVNIVNDIEN